MFFRPPPLDINSVFAELKTDSLYNQSVKLYASALLKHAEYTKSLSTIQKSLDSAPNDAFKAWMLGRVTLAAALLEDKVTVEKTLPLLKSLLSDKKVEENEFSAWALGYIAAVNPDEYKDYKEKMISAADKLTKPADALWAHVMNLQAAARAKDDSTFQYILNQMITFTKKTTVAEALAEIPASDWQAWALGIAAESSAIMGKKELYDDLKKALDAAIVQAGSTANGMLAQISAISASDRISENSSSKSKSL